MCSSDACTASRHGMMIPLELPSWDCPALTQAPQLVGRACRQVKGTAVLSERHARKCCSRIEVYLIGVAKELVPCQSVQI